ncbi:MYO7A [Mytilus edulis]|uniref:MYO7A n=1 Tax=Mytilus edulis TaxID=6550 RepID=A0A8S3PQ92_MYTED|nr:MYO7A [Mytilus edulis]
MPPHVFNVAARAYQRIQEAKTNQVILVSGESGAGKTESTKLMVKHLVYMSPNGNDDLHNKIVQDHEGWTSQTVGRKTEIQRKYTQQMDALKRIGFDDDVCSDKMFFILNDNFHLIVNFAITFVILIGHEHFTRHVRAIIHLTEVKFKEADKVNEPLEIVNIDEVDLAAQLLNVKPLELCLALIKTKTEYGGEQLYYLKNLEQARDSCDALAKAIYERMFGWVIRRINEALNPTNQRENVAASIGILDIAGFENFPVNSFGQLCINFVNERLQNFMNDHVFKNEKRLYRDEGIPLEDIDFKNNEDIIDTFLKKPFGLLNLLDEETKFRQGSDAGFVFKVTTNHDKSEVIKKHEMTIQFSQYAISPERTQSRLRQSKIVHTEHRPNDTRELSTDLGKSLKKFSWSSTKPHRGNANKNKTVISYFRESMDKLLLKMKHAEAHFVRCIKPNEQKQGDNFNGQHVKKQLLYNGITEIAKIRKNGYPIRKDHMEFYNRFFVLHSEFSKEHSQNPGQTIKSLLDKVIPDDLKKNTKLENIEEDNKFPSKTRQDIGTGSIYPDHHIDVNTVDTEDTEEQKKKESKGKEKPFWDIFNNIPREMKSKDVHERSSLRVIKVFIYGLLFLLVFCSLVVQKISLMLLVNYENEERNNITISVMEYTTQVLTIECMHSVGIGFLVFKVLGELHAAYGIMALNTTCFVPSVLNLFPSRATANGDSVKKCLKACRKVTDTIINILAFAAQISVIPLVIYFGVYKMDVSTEETIYSICCFYFVPYHGGKIFFLMDQRRKTLYPMERR